jgi:RNA polymerase sigma-70 factor (ECF subfamily)
MNQDSSSFRDAVERVCAGSEDAAHELIETYAPHIQRVIRRKLNQRMRSKFDSLDFVQMVWASFFNERQRIAEFQEPEELICYLVKMAQHKLIQESRRRLKYQKHNINRERSLDPARTPESSYSRKSATPSQIAMAREQLDGLIKQQSERDRRIVELRLDGATFGEISKRLGIHERTARQVIAKLAPASLRS